MGKPDEEMSSSPSSQRFPSEDMPRVKMDLGEDGVASTERGSSGGFERISESSGVGGVGGGGINFVETSRGRLQHSNSNLSKSDGMDELVMEEYFDTGDDRPGRGGSGGSGGEVRGGIVELKETAAGVGRSRRSSAALITEDNMGRRVSFVRALSDDDDMGLIDDDDDEDSDSDGGEGGEGEATTTVVASTERRRSSPTIDIVKDKTSDPSPNSNGERREASIERSEYQAK